MNISFLLTLVYTVLYSLLTQLVGLALLKSFFKGSWREYPALAMFTSGFMIGQGFLAAIWLILGINGLFKINFVMAILVLSFLLSIYAWPDFILLVKKIWQVLTKSVCQLTFVWKALLLFAIALILFFAFGAIINPPLGDAEAYYMVLPKILAGTGRLIPQPNYYEFSKLGLNGEAHYALLMLLGDFHAAKFFVWFTMLAAAGFIISIGTLLKIKATGQIIAVIILLTSTTFTDYITDGKIDIFSAAFGLGAFYWILETRKKNWLPFILAGLFLGFAVVAKLSNLISLVPGFAVVAVWHSIIYGREQKKFWLSFGGRTLFFIFAISVFFLLALTPHLIKNKVLFNDPLSISNKYKKLQWANPVWSAESVKTPVLTEDINPSQMAEKNVFIRIISYPLAFIFGARGGQGGNLSVLVLAFIPLLFFIRSFTITQKQILLMFLLALGIWITFRAAAVTPRYILPSLLVIIPLIASKTEAIFDLKKLYLLKTVIVCALLFVILTTLAHNLSYALNFTSIVRNKTDASVYYGPHYLSLSYVNTNAKLNERVFLVGYYGFFLRPDLLVNLDNEQEKMDVIFYSQPSPWDYFYDHGFKYVVVQKAPHLLVMDQMESQLQDRSEIKKVYTDPNTDVYFLEEQK